MATYNATHSSAGTVGHPSGAAKAYVITSPVYDAVDNTDLEQGDIVQLIDLPADTMVVGGCIEILEASGNAQITFDVGITGGDVDAFIDGAASNGTTAINFGAQSTDSAMVTSADTLDLLVIDGGSTKTTAWRFRAHVVLVDVSKNPVESATVSTGT
jgi:hypothetical protein